MAPREPVAYEEVEVATDVGDVDDNDDGDERFDVESDYEFDGYFERIGEFNRANIRRRVELPDHIALEADSMTLCEATINEKAAYIRLMSFRQIRDSLLHGGKTFSLPKELGEPMRELFRMMKTMRYEPLENYTLPRVEYMKVLSYLEYEAGIRMLRGDDILLQTYVDEDVEVGETVRLFEDSPNVAGLYGRRMEFMRMREVLEAGLILFNMRYQACTCPEREYLCMEGEDFYTDELVQVYEGEAASIDRLERRKLCDRAIVSVWLMSLNDTSSIVRVRFDVIELADENVSWVDQVLRGVGIDAEQNNWRLMRYSLALKKTGEADRLQLRHTYWSCSHRNVLDECDSGADESSVAIYTSICSVERYTQHGSGGGTLMEVASLVFGRSKMEATEATSHSWRARRRLRRLEPYRMQKYVQQNIVSAMFQ